MPARRRSRHVYVLLLGPRYGDKFPGSGMAPTHEEFETARRRGIPILVFVKNTGEADAPEQTEFKKLVGDYVDGRLLPNPDERGRRA